MLYFMLSNCAGNLSCDIPLNYVHFWPSVPPKGQGYELELATDTRPTPGGWTGPPCQEAADPGRVQASTWPLGREEQCRQRSDPRFHTQESRHTGPEPQG